MLVLSILNEKLEILFFLRENSDFPCLYFLNGKSPRQDYFWPLNFYLSTNFQNFCGAFIDFLMQNDEYISLKVFQKKMICKKAVSRGWCKESRLF